MIYKAKSANDRKALGSAFPERALDLLDISVNRINVARMVYDERHSPKFTEVDVHRRRRRRRIENQSDDGGEKEEISVKIPYLSIYTIAFLVLYISTGVLLYRFCKRSLIWRIDQFVNESLQTLQAQNSTGSDVAKRDSPVSPMNRIPRF
ncbi:unnamed protein product [Caenorhabditis bovis]|uniref:Uncharacterized protein n=1 Tax=Caenorhabditis bovis TaxID=2654633 RepID=A0A8S1EY30_9PELO|nr:unnamed protein product [Caenorhabditis bovis]